MSLLNPRLKFQAATLKQLDRLVTDYPSVTHNSNSVTTAQNTEVDAYATQITTNVNTAKGNTHTAVDATTLSSEDKATLKSTLDSYFAAIAVSTSELKTALATHLSATPTIADYQTAITATYTTPETCPQCNGSGAIQANYELTKYQRETLLDNSTDNIICRTCGSQGITEGQFIGDYTGVKALDYVPVV